MKLDSLISGERATERVEILMTPTEKATYVDRVSSMGLSLGHFFREAIGLTGVKSLLTEWGYRIRSYSLFLLLMFIDLSSLF